MIEFDHKILQCPITKEELTLVARDKILKYGIEQQDNSQISKKNIEEGFIN